MKKCDAPAASLEQNPQSRPPTETLIRVGQSRRVSLLETWFNILIGFGINYFANLAIFPLFGFEISHSANFLMGLIYTVISVVRSYYMRRFFNWLHLRFESF